MGVAECDSAVKGYFAEKDIHPKDPRFLKPSAS